MNERILVIDDNEMLRKALVADLQKKGYKVESVPNLSEGLALLFGSQFDLVVVEPFTEGVKKGGVGPADFFDMFKENPRPCRFLVVLTRSFNLKGAIEMKKYGANNVIQKPCDPVSFLAVIDATFAGRFPSVVDGC